MTAVEEARRDNFTKANIDPSAGVPLAQRRVYCPRCGHDKGVKSQAREGLCRDCAYVLPAAERVAWAA